jgi:SepF-like predicted cell division protein (DUF552 family)
MAIKPDLEEIRRVQEARRIRRERIEAQTERIEALIGGEVWTYGDKGVILTPDQVDQLLAILDTYVE